MGTKKIGFASIIFIFLILNVEAQEQFIEFSINGTAYSINSKNFKRFDDSYITAQKRTGRKGGYYISSKLVGEKKTPIFELELYLPKNPGKFVESGRESYLQEASLNIICPALKVNPEANRPVFATQNNNLKGKDQGVLIVDYRIDSQFVSGTFEATIHLYKGRKSKEAVVLERNAIKVNGKFKCIIRSN